MKNILAHWEQVRLGEINLKASANTDSPFFTTICLWPLKVTMLLKKRDWWMFYALTTIAASQWSPGSHILFIDLIFLLLLLAFKYPCHHKRETKRRDFFSISLVQSSGPIQNCNPDWLLDFCGPVQFALILLLKMGSLFYSKHWKIIVGNFHFNLHWAHSRSEQVRILHSDELAKSIAWGLFIK